MRDKEVMLENRSDLMRRLRADRAWISSAATFRFLLLPQVRSTAQRDNLGSSKNEGRPSYSVVRLSGHETLHTRTPAPLHTDGQTGKDAILGRRVVFCKALVE